MQENGKSENRGKISRGRALKEIRRNKENKLGEKWRQCPLASPEEQG